MKIEYNNNYKSKCKMNSNHQNNNICINKGNNNKQRLEGRRKTNKYKRVDQHN